jgi:hypothetical protein
MSMFEPTEITFTIHGIAGWAQVIGVIISRESAP